jgi:hypothetical protein
MAKLTSKPLAQEAARTGVMVAMRAEGPILCPFFARCDGVVVFSADGAIETFPAGPASGERSICDVITESGIERLVCGFIVDVRLGSCREAIAALAARFDTLPSA